MAKDLVFLKKMRAARKAHRLGKARSLSALRGFVKGMRVGSLREKQDRIVKVSNLSPRNPVPIVPKLLSSSVLFLVLFYGLQNFSYGANGSETQNTSPLVADDTHEVAVFEDCNLAVRFPKQSHFSSTGDLWQVQVPIRLILNDKGGSYFLHLKSIMSLKIFEDDSSLHTIPPIPEAAIALESFDAEALPEIKSEFFIGKSVSGTLIEEVGVQREALCEQLGLDSAGCQEITHFQQFRSKDKKTGYAYDIFFFRTKEFSYLFARKGDRERVDVALQFNSLAPSKPSVDLNDSSHKGYFW